MKKVENTRGVKVGRRGKKEKVESKEELEVGRRGVWEKSKVLLVRRSWARGVQVSTLKAGTQNHPQGSWYHRAALQHSPLK